MTINKNAVVYFFATISALVGYQIGLADLADFTHDEFTIIRKNLNKSCTYQLIDNTLIATCPRKMQ
ncbi:hypothetical protein OXE08_004524 [Salmonella enterica]|nr:hypothetical protein [Salmonella enterica]